MTDLEKKWAAWTVEVCALAMAAAGVWAALEGVRRAARAFIRPSVCDALEGLLLCAVCGVALWICAWECGRRWQAEHGERVCGAPGEDETDKENSTTETVKRIQPAVCPGCLSKPKLFHSNGEFAYSCPCGKYASRYRYATDEEALNAWNRAIEIHNKLTGVLYGCTGNDR